MSLYAGGSLLFYYVPASPPAIENRGQLYAKSDGATYFRNAAGVESRLSADDTGWRSLTLLNGWVYYGGSWATPSYRRFRGVVRLRGLIAGGTLTASMCTLPTGFRPAQHSLFSVVTNHKSVISGANTTNGTHAHPVGRDNTGTSVAVFTTGSLTTPNLSDNGYLSLDSIVFPVG